MKLFIKFILLQLSYLFNRSRSSKIIYYHDLGNKYTEMGTPIDLFIEHLDIIDKKGFSIVEDITQKENQIMICFDDGWAGLYEHRELLISRNIFPTTFIAVDLIGQKNYLSLDQILELQDCGFHFECHSWTHSDLTTLNTDQLLREIKDSKLELESLLGNKISAICFPRGRFSDEIIDLSLEAGYDRMYSSISGDFYLRFKNNKLLCRNLVQDTSPKTLS